MTSQFPPHVSGETAVISQRTHDPAPRVIEATLYVEDVLDIALVADVLSEGVTHNSIDPVLRAVRGLA